MRLCLCLSLLALGASCLLAAESPLQWSSDPHRNMRVQAEDLPAEIGEQNQLWSLELGGGRFFNVPTVIGDRLYCGMDGKSLPERPEGRPRAGFLCVDVASGEPLWQWSGEESSGYGISDVPIIDGDRIYFRSGDRLFCLSTEGEELWSRPTGQAFYGTQMHGASGVGLIIGEHWWIPTGHGSGSDDHNWEMNGFERPWHPNVIVLDTTTGDLVAQDDVVVPAFQHGQWSSLSSAVIDGRQLVFWPDSAGWVHAFAAPASWGSDAAPAILEHVWWLDANPASYRQTEDGKPMPYSAYGIGPGSRSEGWCEMVSAPTYFDGRLYVALTRDVHYSSKHKEDRRRYIGNGGLVCIDPSGTGDVTASHKLWTNTELNRTFCTPSISEEGLLFIADHAGWLNCFDAVSGERLWQGDIHSNMWNWSQVLADGKVYVLNEQKDFFVFEADRDGGLLFHTELDRPNNPAVGATHGLLIVGTGKTLAAYTGPGSSFAE